MSRLLVYMDHHATTPADLRVVEAMGPFFGEHFGNAASRTHSHGWKAEEAVEQARNQIATLIGCQPREIVFTSGATESNNLAILGVVGMHRRRASPAATPCHIVTSAIEHHAVLDPCAFVESGDAVSDARADARGSSTTRARGPVRVTRLPPMRWWSKFQNSIMAGWKGRPNRAQSFRISTVGFCARSS